MSAHSDTHVALPSDMELVLKVVPMPNNCNASGDIFGGWVMSQVDLAGSVIPARVAQGRVATVAVKEFVFKQPVHLGDILSLYAAATHIGRTSVTVRVEVYSERLHRQGRYTKVTEASLTYVAITEMVNRAPCPRKTKQLSGTSTHAYCPPLRPGRRMAHAAEQP